MSTQARNARSRLLGGQPRKLGGDDLFLGGSGQKLGDAVIHDYRAAQQPSNAGADAAVPQRDLGPGPAAVLPPPAPPVPGGDAGFGGYFAGGGSDGGAGAGSPGAGGGTGDGASASADGAGDGTGTA